MADFLIFIADDADSLALVQADGEIVHHNAVEPGSYEADDYQPERVDEEGTEADNDSGDGYRGAYVPMELFLHYHCHNVQAAGGGIDTEQECL